MGVIGHIIGIDEIHKKKLIKQLPKNIIIIDLDIIQQKIYNDKDVVKQKMIWNGLTRDIKIQQKQKRLIGSKRVTTNNIDKRIKNLMVKRNTVRQKIHTVWKNKMSNEIEKQMVSDKNILVMGFNIFPRDYRVKINLPINTISINNGMNNYSNKILYNTKPGNYASNQIKYYINAYRDKIIRGKFNLSLLDPHYLSTRYEKFFDFYHKQGYSPVDSDDLVPVIKNLNKQQESLDRIKEVYIATLFKSGDKIPVNSKTPIEGFLTRDDAIANIKTKIKKNIPIYIYKANPDQFQMINGKLIAVKEINPINEESLLMT